MKFKVGDRVVDEFLGSGEVLDVIDISDMGSYMILFDSCPEIEYNMGCNPCLCWGVDLRVEK